MYVAGMLHVCCLYVAYMQHAYCVQHACCVQHTALQTVAEHAVPFVAAAAIMSFHPNFRESLKTYGLMADQRRRLLRASARLAPTSAIVHALIGDEEHRSLR